MDFERIDEAVFRYQVLLAFVDLIALARRITVIDNHIVVVDIVVSAAIGVFIVANTSPISGLSVLHRKEIRQFGSFREDSLELLLLLETIDTLLQSMLERESFPVLVHQDGVSSPVVCRNLLRGWHLRLPPHNRLL